MAIDPSISLRYKSPQIQSPLDSFTKTVQISEMLSQMQDRQARVAEYAQQAPLRQAENLARQQELAEATVLKKAATESFKPYDPEVGDLEYDDDKWNEILDTADIPGVGKASYLKPQFQQIKGAQLAAHRELALNELNRANTMLAREAVQIKNFLELPEEKRKAAFSGLRGALIAANPAWGKLLPYEYDASIEAKLRPVVERHELQMSYADRLAAAKSEAETRKSEAEAKRAEKEAAVPGYHNAPPGTLIIKTDSMGKEIERIEVPFKEEEKSDKQVEAELVEEAYGQLKLGGKARDKMTAAEKVAARRWDEAITADPAKKTDLDKMMALYRSSNPEDKALFNALKGNFDNGPTVSNKVSILNSLMRASRNQSGTRVDPALYEKNRKLYLPIWPDIPGYEEAQKLMPAATKPAPVTRLPKPGKAGEEASDDILRVYLKANNNDKEAARKALEAAGWK